MQLKTQPHRMMKTTLMKTGIAAILLATTILFAHVDNYSSKTWLRKTAVTRQFKTLTTRDNSSKPWLTRWQEHSTAQPRQKSYGCVMTSANIPNQNYGSKSWLKNPA